MPTANVIQLRQLLKAKMPELRLGFDDLAASRQNFWSTGISQIDEPLQGGLPKGALSEIVAGPHRWGSGLILHSFLSRAAKEKQIVALVDGRDSFEVTQVEERTLSRLLWVRCRSAGEAMKAADLLLRDSNLPLVLLDLALNPAAELRRIPATTWFRFQRILEQTSSSCLVFTPQPMVSPAQIRITLEPSRLSLEALERDPAELLGELKMEVADARRSREGSERLRSSA